MHVVQHNHYQCWTLLTIFWGCANHYLMQPLISLQDNGNFLVPLTSSKKTERKKLLLSTMLKDHVGQGGQNRYNLKRGEDVFCFQYSCHAFHIMDRVVFKRKMEWMANSIELFEKELSLVHHSNRLETRDTGKTRPNQKLSFHTLSNSRWNSFRSMFSCTRRENAASSITLNWKQFKVHLSNSSCGSGNGKEYWIGRA